MHPLKKISPSPSLRKVSVPRIKLEMSDVSYLSDDLVMAYITPETNYTVSQPVAFDGLSAVIMMSGEARISYDLKEFDVKQRDVAIFTPESVVQTLTCTANASAFLISFSKSFINDIQIDLSTSLPLYMRFGKNPILHLTSADVGEVLQLFRLIKTMISSDKERYRAEIIKTLFTSIFYILTEIVMRGGGEHDNKRGRCEIIFDEFLTLLQLYSKSERNVKFYAEKLNISAKYLSAVVKDVSGKTAAKWIDESVILEAKTLLIYSGMSIQEIANYMNFSTQSFFGKYFKQHTGISPSRFKRKG